MPTKGWSGLTKDDNSQALAIAKVMKKFTDEGVEVWLRFAHEIKYVASLSTLPSSPLAAPLDSRSFSLLAAGT